MCVCVCWDRLKVIINIILVLEFITQEMVAETEAQYYWTNKSVSLVCKCILGGLLAKLCYSCWHLTESFSKT